ncbi:MAG: tRNA (adenosine(37)-N6)-threonylcarbamoyltransferase complex transferase subunit TsaD [Candidatus Doudnabacteria bacterium]|nr:tRNA (adenosine(37)-N6)-threonylcarbamoyltransferase complex transferase subunit TsaD [Candidatus Doudnabacteria bacterium]
MSKKFKTILALESSCDETAAAVIEGNPRSEGYPRIRSNIVASQTTIHSRHGGVIPEVAARNHVPVIIPCVKLALKQAGKELKNVDLIAVTQGPGLITSLMVGVQTAKTLGIALDIPVVPINHLEAHIYSNFAGKIQKSKFKNQIFPALILIVSGGHTLLVIMKGHGNFKIVGETLDDAAGEAFDKSAKILGLGYPGGPRISALAKKGNPKTFDFPRPMIKSNNLSFSFSGLKTAVLYTVQNIARSSKKLDNKTRKNLAASVQQAIVDVLISKTEQAIKKFHPRTIMLGGGVSANELLRKNFKLLGEKHRIRSVVPDPEFATDNAGMIGLAAYYRYKNKKIKVKNFEADPNLKLVQETSWHRGEKAFASPTAMPM